MRCLCEKRGCCICTSLRCGAGSGSFTPKRGSGLSSPIFGAMWKCCPERLSEPLAEQDCYPKTVEAPVTCRRMQRRGSAWPHQQTRQRRRRNPPAPCPPVSPHRKQQGSARARPGKCDGPCVFAGTAISDVRLADRCGCSDAPARHGSDLSPAGGCKLGDTFGGLFEPRTIPT